MRMAAKHWGRRPARSVEALEEKSGKTPIASTAVCKSKSVGLMANKECMEWIHVSAWIARSDLLLIELWSSIWSPEPALPSWFQAVVEIESVCVRPVQMFCKLVQSTIRKWTKKWCSFGHGISSYISFISSSGWRNPILNQNGTDSRFANIKKSVNGKHSKSLLTMAVPIPVPDSEACKR